MGEEFVDPNSLERILIQDTFLRERSMQHRVGAAAFSILGAVKPLFTEQVYLDGLENLFQDGDLFGEAIPGPFLWLLKHESYYDVPNISPEFPKIPRFMKYVIMGRERYLPFAPLNYLFLKLFNIIPIKRGWLEEEMTPEKKKEIDDFNRKTFANLMQQCRKGYHPFVLPEGTTRNNGEIIKIRSGAYNMSHFIEDGKLNVVNCVPVGNTYDLMSGTFGRQLVFLQIGKMFQYEPAEYDGERPGEYMKKDIHKFSATIRQQFAELNTLTLPQMIGLMLRDCSRRGIQYVSRNEMALKARFTLMEIKARDDKEPMLVDPELLTTEGMQKRMENFYSNLIRRGYVTRTIQGDRLNREIVLQTCAPERYKKENLLAYMTNRIISVLDERPGLRIAFEHGLGIEDTTPYKPLK